MTRKPPDKIGKSLQELRLLLTQTEVGMAEHVYPKLKVGHVWQIPDEISGELRPKIWTENSTV